MADNDREALANLIRRAGWDAKEADAARGYACGFDPDLFVADAILAKWKLVPVAPPTDRRLVQFVPNVRDAGWRVTGPAGEQWMFVNKSDAERFAATLSSE